MDTKEGVIEAVQKYAKSATDEGYPVDITNVNYEELLTAITEYRQSGHEGTTFDLLLEVNDTIGLHQFGIFTL